MVQAMLSLPLGHGAAADDAAAWPRRALITVTNARSATPPPG